MFLEADILNSSGVNVDLWSLSLTSFTGVYIAVTIKIFVWTRWYTQTTIFCYTGLSILVYIIYIWVSEHLGLTQTEFVAATHSSPLFWLTILFLVLLLYAWNISLEYWRLKTNCDASDWLRQFVKGQRDAMKVE